MSGKGTLKNFKAMIAEARPAERSVSICLRGDLVAEHEAAVRELDRLDKDPATSLAGNGAAELADRILALEAEMLESSIDFRLRALPKRDLRALTLAHPPRRDPETNEIVDRDKFVMVNLDTFFDALLKACTVEPELDDEDWLNLLGHNDEEVEKLKAEGRENEIVEGSLSQPQWDRLTDVAWAVNGKEVNIPFSHVASRMKRDSAAE